MELVTEIYEETRSFPDNEKYGLVSQIRRSAVSVPSNIAEGYGRNSNGEFIRFLHISMGSLFEIQTQLQIAQNLNYLEVSASKELFDLSREIERMVSSFIRSLN
jgi:four helix bundle protein